MPPKGHGTDEPKAIQRVTNSIDRAIGKQLKHFRTRAGISKEDCARKIGISAELLDAYERAKQRVTASHLSMLASVIGVSVEVFFQRPSSKLEPAKDGNVVPLREPSKRQAQTVAALERRLLEGFRAFQDDDDRQLVLDLVNRLGRLCCSAPGR